MVCFILARDKQEFEKYKASSLESDSCIDIRNNNDSYIASIIFRMLISADGQASPLLVVFEEKEKNKCKENMDASSTKDLLALLVEVFERTQKELENARVRNKMQDKIVDNLKNCMDKVCVGATQYEDDTGNEIEIDGIIIKRICEETVVFIHWGGGAPKTYEDNFAKMLKECLDAEDSQFTLRDSQLTQSENVRANVRAYAFSSRRAELFDVTKPKIEFPKTVEEVKALEDKFRVAKNIVDAKKIMTEYVLAAHNAGDKSELIYTEVDVFGDAVQEVVGKMGKEWGSGYLDKDEQNCRAGLVDEYFSCKSSGRNPKDKQVAEQVAELFTKILEEEV